MEANKSLVTEDETVSSLMELKAKIDAKEPGYKVNSASKLISALKLIFDKL